jgi:AraC-like DNA-binding protein
MTSPIYSTKKALTWEYNLRNIIRNNFQNHSFDNQILARQLAISERQLYRKIKEQTGLSPQKYILCFRLEQAMKYIVNGHCYSVKELAYKIGYQNVGYFIRQFYKKYGKTPLGIMQEQGWR